MPNEKHIDYSNYISPDAFCPKDATKEERNAFLKKIGVKKMGCTTTINANFTAKHILQHTHIVPLENYGLAIYNGKHYEIADAQWVINHIIYTLLNQVEKCWNTKYEQEIVESIKRSFNNKFKAMDTENIVNVKNGILDLNTMELKEHSPAYLCSNTLDAEYDATAECPRWMAFLNQIFMGDQELIDLLQEVFGACISNLKTDKCAIFYGPGMNGKSVVADVLKAMIGENSVSHLNLERFQSRFGLQSLLGKRLNIASELEAGEFKLSTANFKAVCTGDPVHVDIKYKDPIEIALNCKLVFLTNTLPDTADDSGGYFRRIMILPFNYTVKAEERDMDLPEKLKAEMSGILNWAIAGLKRLESNNRHFTKAQKAQECLEQYKFGINNVGAFFEEKYTPCVGGKVQKSDIYNEYRDECVMNCAPELSRQEFWKKLASYFRNAGITPVYKKLKGIDYLHGYEKNEPSFFRSDYVAAMRSDKNESPDSVF